MGMNDKRVTTLYLSNSLVLQAKARGLNLSELVNRFLSELLSDEEERKLSEVEKQIEELREKLKALEAARAALQAQVEEKQERRAKMRELIEKTRELITLVEKEKTAETHSEKEKLRKEKLKKLNALKKELGLNDGEEDTVIFVRAINKGDLATAKRIIEERMSK